jgi:hypothetical protein
MPDDPDEREEAPSDDPADTAVADTVEEADKESFPASDAPASWAGDDGV